MLDSCLRLVSLKKEESAKQAQFYSGSKLDETIRTSGVILKLHKEWKYVDRHIDDFIEFDDWKYE
jgi:hypothetical protein